MKSIRAQLTEHVQVALHTAFGPDAEGVDPSVKPTGNPKFGDYQSNVAMGLAKKLGQKPRDVAQKIVGGLPPATMDMLGPPEIAGPGFINLRLKTQFLQTALESIPPADDPDADRLGIDPVSDAERETVVIDYSSPNVAKQMHVGHLRSTIIGDTIARVLEFEGHEVIRQNHLGDWGTPMGMVVTACLTVTTIAEFKRTGEPPKGYLNSPDFARALQKLKDVRQLEEAYRAATKGCREDPDYANKVQVATKWLQEKKPFIVQAWQSAVTATLDEAFASYTRLGVGLGADSIRGESFYQPFLPAVVEELQEALAAATSASGMLSATCREDQGALCVFLERSDGTPAFKNPNGDALPMIVQKSDGAFLYATTDVAGLAFRINHIGKRPLGFHSAKLHESLKQHGGEHGGLGADRILYVVGSPQKLHFQMLFATVRALGWTRPGDGSREVRLEHVTFGSVLGENRKMLKTRTGENVKLKDLLDEAVKRAGDLVRQTEADPDKRRGFDDDEIKKIAETVGIAAVKYADLCQNRNTDYVFSWDKMLALQGNTAPYMLYAYARIRSIYRKGAESAQSAIVNPKLPGQACPGLSSNPQSSIVNRQSSITLADSAERDLALSILQLAETLDAVAGTLLPNILCEYLYDLAGRFMAFYESCPVLQAPDEATTASRLGLCDLTARALRLGLGLLGIPTLERM